MASMVYLNGRYLPDDQAVVHPLDRGFVFADGVYEVVRYYAGRPLAMAEHLRRLAESLAAVRIELPDDTEPFERISQRLVEANECPDCYVYWQVTRGVAERDHAFPNPPVRPTVFACVKPLGPLCDVDQVKPMTAITHPDIRWTRCAIKSLALLPNVLARQAAADAGADEAILVREPFEGGRACVTEATARSVLAVFKGELHTHPLDGSILGSITRRIVLQLAGEMNVPVVEQAFDVERMMQADELMLVGTTTEIRPVVQVDGKPVGAGDRPITRRLTEALHAHIRQACGL